MPRNDPASERSIVRSRIYVLKRKLAIAYPAGTTNLPRGEKNAGELQAEIDQLEAKLKELEPQVVKFRKDADKRLKVASDEYAKAHTDALKSRGYHRVPSGHVF